jgi:RimJ/RimL family protein N-acetyltransferase
MAKIVRKLDLPADDERLAIPPPVTPELPEPWGVRLIQPGSEDVKLVHQWMHQEHVRSVMHKDWPLEEWEAEIREQMADTFSRPFIASYDGKDMGYIELYRAKRDVVANTYDADTYDIGLHGALCDPEALREHYAYSFWMVLLEGIFKADPQCKRMVSEPDAGNTIVRKLNQKVCEATGGRFVGEVALPHKTAALFLFDRDAYRQARQAG